MKIEIKRKLEKQHAYQTKENLKQRDKERHYVMIKRAIQEDIMIVDIYAPNIGTPRYVRQILTTIKGEISSNTAIVGNFNIHFCQWINHSERKLTRRHVP